jgi:hypothetical protein
MFDGKEVVQNIENVGNEAAHHSRHRYRAFEKNGSNPRMVMGMGEDAVELALSRRESGRSATYSIGSQHEDHRRESGGSTTGYSGNMKGMNTPDTPTKGIHW